MKIPIPIARGNEFRFPTFGFGLPPIPGPFTPSPVSPFAPTSESSKSFPTEMNALPLLARGEFLVAVESGLTKLVR